MKIEEKFPIFLKVSSRQDKMILSAGKKENCSNTKSTNSNIDFLLKSKRRLIYFKEALQQTNFTLQIASQKGLLFLSWGISASGNTSVLHAEIESSILSFSTNSSQSVEIQLD